MGIGNSKPATPDYNPKFLNLAHAAQEEQRKREIKREEQEAVVDFLYAALCAKIDGGYFETLAAWGLTQSIYYSSNPFIKEDNYFNYLKLAQRYPVYKNVRIVLQGNETEFKVILIWSDD